ncbi:MAG: leucyl/phenylalanyl-tRNA--protein transferase [Fimbriiglobus sp.]
MSPEKADAEGLVGVGGDLKPATLVAAYADGVFPWFGPGDPFLWWSPDPRGVIEPDGLHVSRSLARTIRSGKFRVTANAAFGDVMRGCAENRDGGTWITDEILAAYEELHRLGHAHSVEVWVSGKDGSEPTLAGGIYGVSVGGLFAGESMFHTVTDASKVALASLVARLNERGYVLFDVQMVTEHTTRMGAVEIPRRDYLRRLKAAVAKPGVSFA